MDNGKSLDNHNEVTVGTRKTYTTEFKREAVRLTQQPDITLASVARDLGIGESLLRKWVADHRSRGELAFPGSGKERLTPEQEEIKRLRRENEILRQEREILKKAAAFFAKEAR